uniref:Uncharacterized protein n=1 Tax=Siphoviridae sp. ctqPo10 TaxID=2827948 RepID=A0A8S5SVC6_9CAUD|nr:MAG TPA: hypothetical protein [Siphoviridae sp. ctqPo10]DAS43539.1 MAG TPA: hypothetical protein [Caudoviricetes sp.]DAT99306.1 MAG TPA: hypothetical protein [Caudoviricetes sp.]
MNFRASLRSKRREKRGELFPSSIKRKGYNT